MKDVLWHLWWHHRSMFLSLLLLMLLPVVTSQRENETTINICENHVEFINGCNGKEDCSSIDDELLCMGKLRCRIDEFRCNLTECLSLTHLCDGRVDCMERSDEANCSTVSQSSLCKATQFSCSLSGPCIPLADLCDGVGDCPNGQDEARCSMAQVVQVSTNISVDVGEDISLTCETRGYPPPFITWLHNFKPLYHDSRYTLTSYYGYGVLHISKVRLSDEGMYTCVIVSRLYGSTIVQPAISVTVNDASPVLCENHLQQTFVEGSYFHTIKSFVSGPASQAAADIIFVVDESGSMATEHEWIQKEVVILDEALKEQGVGVGERKNLYALVGFGRNDPSAILGITLTSLTSLEGFLNATKLLVLNGIFEDGYAAINHALEAIETRPNTAKQIIFISDEDRGVLRSDLSFDIIAQKLNDAGCVLNVAVNQGFLSSKNDSRFSLGLRGDGQSYTFDRSSSVLFSESQGGVRSSSDLFDFGSTYEDYVQLAFTTQGVAWDLNQLREGGDYSIAFTNAFTQVKIDEVMSVYRFCFVCLCTYPNETCSIRSNIQLYDCIGEYTAVNVVVSPDTHLIPTGSNASFQCLTSVSNINVSLNITWEYPAGANVITEGTNLNIINVNSNSEGDYRCIVQSNLQRTVTAVGTLRIDTRCSLSDGSFLVLDGLRYILLPITDNTTQAANIILLVDESGSMTMQHSWIPEMIEQLDNALVNVGIGVNPRNRFGVVGFGDDCTTEATLDQAFLTNESVTYVPADRIVELTQRLQTGGKYEDGYRAIASAFKQYTFGDRASLFILISDEDRDALSNITRDDIESMLTANEVILNVVVSEEYTGGEARAFGIDADGTAYLYDPSSDVLFRNVGNFGVPVKDSAHGSTNEDYTQLALQVKGGSWDIGLLQQGGQVARAFTNSFVYAKVVEVQRQMEECFQCFCNSEGPYCEPIPGGNNISFCVRMPVPPRPTETPIQVEVDVDFIAVMPNENYTIVCQVNSSARLGWSFNGGDLPANALIERQHGRSMLTIYHANKENEGQYACLATSPSSAYNGIALVYVEFNDPSQDLLLSPIEATFTKSTNRSITCNVSYPAAFSWSFNDGPLPSNAIVFDVSPMSSLLVLYIVDSTNDGAFTCMANDSATGIVNEDTAYISVSDIKLNLSVDPVFVETSLGARVEISCILDSDFNISPVWIREGSEALPSGTNVVELDTGDADQVGFALVVNVTQENAGRYFCFAEFANITAKQDIYIAILPVNDTFSVTISSTSKVSALVGSNISLLCEANMDASITWFFNGLPIKDQESVKDPSDAKDVPLNAISLRVSQHRSLLSILNAMVENTGVYECSGISNEGAVFSDVVTVNITTILPETRSVVPTLSSSSPIVKDTKQPSLTITPSIINTLIKEILPTPIINPTNLREPSVNVQPSSVSLPANVTFIFVCTISFDDLPLSIEWRFNSSSLPSNAVVTTISPKISQLEIKGTQEENAGLYYCIAELSTGKSATGSTNLTFIQTN